MTSGRSFVYTPRCRVAGRRVRDASPIILGRWPLPTLTEEPHAEGVSSTDHRGDPRLPHLDNLRTALVAWVIACHALLGYSAVGGWPYDEINEVSFSAPSELVLVVILGPSGLVVIGLFFFIAGLLTEQSVDRHGWLRYSGGRMTRLGLPWLASALMVWPAAVWIAYRGAGRQVSFWWVFRHRDPFLDSGSLWFALVLLIFSVGFAAGSALYRRLVHRPSRPPGVRPRQRRSGHDAAIHIAAATVAITVLSFIVRIRFPVHSGQIADLHLWWWPQCLGMFLLGIGAARHGWGRHVPDRVRRGCGVAVLVTLGMSPLLALASGLRDATHGTGPYLGGWHWQSLITGGVESTLLVGGSVWLVGTAERRLSGSGQRTTGWTRAAFGAFVIQGPVLMVLSTVARLADVPAEVKAPLVAAAAIVISFWVGGRISSLFRSRAGVGSGDSRPAPALGS